MQERPSVSYPIKILKLFLDKKNSADKSQDSSDPAHQDWAYWSLAEKVSRVQKNPASSNHTVSDRQTCVGLCHEIYPQYSYTCHSKCARWTLSRWISPGFPDSWCQTLPAVRYLQNTGYQWHAIIADGIGDLTHLTHIAKETWAASNERSQTQH